MGGVKGFYDILAVGGYTTDDSGQPVTATEDNIQKHFPEPQIREEPENNFGPVEMPSPDFSSDMPELRDDGFYKAGPSHEDNPNFQDAVDFAEQNGLTAVLVQPRQDVDSQGYETGMQTLAYKTPKIIYLDQEGNQVEPEGAPQNNPFGALFDDLSSLQGDLIDTWGQNAHDFSAGNGFPIENMFSTIPNTLTEMATLEQKFETGFDFA